VDATNEVDEMLMPELKKAAYDPGRYIDIETVDEAVSIITTETEGMTAQQRWENETPALMALIEKYVKKESFVLDYGCGIGRLAKPLIAKHQCKVVGVDISPNMRALAASCVDSPLFCAIDPLMFDVLVNGFKFDAAISVWALQHCVDLDAVIRRLSSVVKVGGHLFVVNNKGRCVPVEGGEWADDGLDIEAMIKSSGFSEIEQGKLDEQIAPGWMREGTFWAIYRRE
jgi:SAM-dependent methyltransferase